MSEQQHREEQLTERVVASFDGAPDARLKELMQALTRPMPNERMVAVIHTADVAYSWNQRRL